MLSMIHPWNGSVHKGCNLLASMLLYGYQHKIENSSLPDLHLKSNYISQFK